MEPYILMTIIVLVIISIPVIFLGLKIMNSDWMYDQDSARWKSGINLPGLESKPGDRVEHGKFKRFVGLNIIMLIILITIITIIYLLTLQPDMADETVLKNTIIYLFLLYVAISVPLTLLYSNYKERYIERVNSEIPKHHKIILFLILGILFGSLAVMVPFFI